MNIFGIGTDIVSVERIKKSLKRLLRACGRNGVFPEIGETGGIKGSTFPGFGLENTE